MELESKIAGTWISEEKDKLLQDKFWSILKTWNRFSEFQGNIQSKMADFWLRENHDWFLSKN